ncbi:hypothetical protein E6C55_25605 [Cohnella fermenti]|uniref:Polysaccharide lyase 8 N-terminal alpha-helical domain-containing protein n=1 Tax=Cohnella fermenti TaxID=2565925 RepID=A0A4S4BIH5_9BACL|nr:hypothetical protein E6C55_25605 [Cohnella fermenti]
MMDLMKKIRKLAMRRVLLVLLTAVLTLPLMDGALLSRTAYADEEDAFDALRAKWALTLTGGDSYSLSDPDIAERVTRISMLAKTYWERMDKSPARTYLWSDLTGSGGSGQITALYGRIFQLAQGYATYGSIYYQDEDLAADIAGALDWMNDHLYSAASAMNGNWYDYKIGAPLALNNTVTLLYDELSPLQIENYMAAVDHFTPTTFYDSETVARTDQYEYEAANMAWKSMVIGVRAILVKSEDKLLQARSALSVLYDYVTERDGFYADGSYVGHTANAYTGSYGVNDLSYTASLTNLLQGSPWEVDDPDRSNIYK